MPEQTPAQGQPSDSEKLLLLAKWFDNEQASGRHPQWEGFDVQADLRRIASELTELRGRVKQKDDALVAVREHGNLCNHNHWDHTMGSGAGCAICVDQRIARDAVNAALSASPPDPSSDKRGICDVCEEEKDGITSDYIASVCPDCLAKSRAALSSTKEQK